MAAAKGRDLSPHASPSVPYADHAGERMCYPKSWMLSWQDKACTEALPCHIAIVSGLQSHQELDNTSLNIQHPMKGPWETGAPATAPVSGSPLRAVLLQQACVSAADPLPC